MKNYLNFTLTGKQLLPIWIAFLVFFIIPYYFLTVEFSELTAAEVPAGGPSKLFFVYLSIVLTMSFIFIFTFSRLALQSIEYRGIKIVCDYHVGKYIGIVISGLVLSIVTLGIYIPWMIRNIHRFFVHSVSYDSHKFAFKGEGSKLFLIITLTIFIPFLIVGIVLFSILNSEINLWIYQLIVVSIMISLIYMIFNWLVNVRFKDYLIKLDIGFFTAMWKIAIELLLAVIFVFIFEWLIMVSNTVLGDSNLLVWNADFFPVTGKIVIELVIAVITAGFYLPMAFIRLYRYFTAHTKSNIVEGTQISIGYDGDQVSVFLFIWGQILLTVITAGFYFPWAFSKVIKRVLTQTFVTVNDVEMTTKV